MFQTTNQWYQLHIIIEYDWFLYPSLVPDPPDPDAGTRLCPRCWEEWCTLPHWDLRSPARSTGRTKNWNSPWRSDRRSTKGHGKFHGNDPTFELHNFFPHQKGEISTCRMTSVDFRGPRDLPWLTYVVDSHFKIQDMKNMQFNFNAKCSLSWIVAQFVMDMYQTNVLRHPKHSADSCSFPGSSLRQSSTASIAAAAHAKHGCVTWNTYQNAWF